MTLPVIATPHGTSPLSAVELVNEAWLKYGARGDEWILLASQTISDLGSVHVTPMTFTVNFDIESFLPSYVAPSVPTPGALPAVLPQQVDPPTLAEVELRALGEAPAEPDIGGLIFAPPSPPTTPPPTVPTTTVVLDEIVVPDRPAGLDVLPDVPTLEELGIVVVPTITLPAFLGERPDTAIAPPLDGQLDWSELEYSSALATALSAKFGDMLQGSLGLPAAIENAIFDRGRAKEERLSRKFIQELSEDMDTRNLTEPNGIFGGRLQAAREANRVAVGGLNQEITIESLKLSIENVKFAAGQGMAWEQTLIAMNGAMNERALRVALAVRDYGIARVNALIGIATIQQQAYATDATVWRQQLEGELAKLQKTRLEMEVEQLRGTMNSQRLAQYQASLEGLRTLAGLYQSDIEAAKVRGEINVQRIDAAKLLVEKYVAQVDGWKGLQDAYRAKVEGALGTVKYAEVLGGLYATRMEGYKTKSEAYFNEGRFQIERNGQTLELFKANLAGADQDLRGQLAQLDAVLRGNDQGVRLYEARGNVAAVESSAIDRAVGMKLEQEKARTTVELEKARIAIDQALKIGEILVEQIKAKAAAVAQLAAASQAGVNFGASISGSLGVGYSYSQSFGYSGDTSDKDPYF
jgi:hypothetical protein